MDVKQIARDIAAIVSSLESQNTNQLESIALNFPHVLASLNLLNESDNLDILLLKLHAIQRCFYHLHQLSIEYDEADTSSDELSALSIYADLAIELLNNANTIFSFAIDPTLPRSHLFTLYHTIYLLIRPCYPKIASILGSESIQPIGDRIIETHLIPMIVAVFSLRPPLPSSHESFSISFTLSLLTRLLKDHSQHQETSFSINLEILTSNEQIQSAYLSFFNYLVLEADKSLFSMLGPPLFVAAKLSKRIGYCSFLSIPDSLIIPSLLEEEPEERLRDPLVARKVFGALKLEFLELSGNFAEQISPKFLMVAQRVLTLLFAPPSNAPTSNLDLSGTSLVSKRYKVQDVEEMDEDDEMEALRRSVLIYTLNIAGSILKSTMTPHSAVVSHILLLTRTLLGRGLFSSNPSTAFFNLIGQHDAHLLEGLYWAQQLLLCGYHHLHPISRGRMPQETLIGQICEKVPQVPVFLSVLNPYSLFVAFLDFLKHDHSLMMDFMLSSESEWVLKYLLDFVKFCLVDWNRTFIALYNLKSKTIDPDPGTTLSTEEVDSLLESLLQKQMKEMELDPHGDNEWNSDSEESPDSLEDIALSTETDKILASNFANQNTFDSVVSFLIRLLVHLETASNRGLIGYNIEPLLVRLREMERNYEKSGVPPSSAP